MTETRYCPPCGENVAPEQTECPFCGEQTMLRSDAEEAYWTARYAALDSEPAPTLAEQHRAAWEAKMEARA